MATDMKARQLIKQVPPVSVNLNFEGTDTITFPFPAEGWEVVQPYAGANLFLVWRGYIDLAGYTQDDLTFFTQAVDVQHGPLDASSGLSNNIIFDLVTSRRIRDSEVHLYQGFLPNTPIPCLDLQEVIYGEWANRTPYAATITSLTNVSGGTVGTGNPTASDRLHITRIVASYGTGAADTLTLGGTNFVIGGVTGHEKDLVYIERLRRAYTQDPGRNV